VDFHQMLSCSCHVAPLRLRSCIYVYMDVSSYQ
jgi:hypothetical protein